MKLIKSENTGYDYEVYEAQINGFDWRFSKRNGALYALFAVAETDDDDTWSWEPADPSEQRYINQMKPIEAAALAKAKIEASFNQ
ncbi:MAG: hypothetical protein G8D91_00360 [gamma proteobacterium symbiont of Clathrolucina costata]